MKLALVTGGYRRIGAAIASALAHEGWTLALHSHNPADPDDGLQSALHEWHGFVADLGDSADVERLVPAVAAHFAHSPSLLVNCASLFEDDDASNATFESLARFQAVNALAPQALALAAARAGGEGAVINIIDQRIRNPVPDQLSYSLSKAALASATRTLAVALAPRWRVNAVAPGLTLPSRVHDATVMERARGIMPLKLLPQPEDIAEAVVYFAKAKAVTGQTLFVDGGASMRGFERDFGNL